jgi:hypothetical protein
MIAVMNAPEVDRSATTTGSESLMTVSLSLLLPILIVAPVYLTLG